MSILKIVLCLYLTSFAVHYGWRMRGTVIGGEKGAMLPGMLAGLTLSLFAGKNIAELFYIPAAAGLIGMSYGGIEPYGDSISMFENTDNPHYNPKKGLIGLAIKGALWFSIAGGFIGMGFFALTGKFTLFEIVTFVISVILAQFLGYIIFNQPYNPSKNKLPKIYLSYESRDEWGSNVGVLLALIVFAIVKKNFITIIMTSCGFIFGAIGWLIAMKLYYYTDNPFKSGKYLYPLCFRNNGIVGAWSNMEFCLGTFGGLGLALGFVLSSKYISSINKELDNICYRPGININDNVVIIIFAALALLLLAVNLFEYYCDHHDMKYNSFIMDCIERPLFNTLPFALILTGSLTAGRIMTLFMIIYCLFLKNSFDRLKPGKSRIFIIAVTSIICILLFTFCVKCEKFNFIWLVIAGTIPYIASEIIWVIIAKGKDSIKIFKTVNDFSFMMVLLSFQSLILMALSLIYLKTL